MGNRLIALFLLLWIILPGAAHANDPLVVKGSVRGGMVRLFFYCTQPVQFTPSLVGNKLTVSFNRGFAIDYTNLALTMRDYVTSASETGDGKKVILTLAQSNYRIRQFVSDGFVGVDLVPTDAPIAAAPPPATPKAVTPPKLDVPLASIPSFQPSVPKVVPERAPAPAKPPVVAKPKPPAPKPVPEVKKEKVPEKPKPAPAPTQQEKAPAAPVVTTVLPRKADNAYSLRFVWQQPVNAAIFERANTLWVIFDNPDYAERETIGLSHPHLVGKPDVIDNRHFTILRFPLVQHDFAVIKDGMDWVIDFTKKPAPSAHPVGVEVDLKIPPGPRVMLGVPPETQPLRVMDPDIGDELVIYPLRDTGQEVDKERGFTDFKLLKTRQGAVVQIIGEGMRFQPLVKGIEITSPSLKLFRATAKQEEPAPTEAGEHGEAPPPAPKEEPVHDSIPEPVKEPAPTFDASKSFLYKRRMLERAIINAKPAEQSDARLALAKFLLKHDNTAEALGVLDELQRRDPIYGERYNVKFMHAVAWFGHHRYRRANEEFFPLEKDIPQDYKPAAALLRAAIDGKINQSSAPIPYPLTKEHFRPYYSLALKQDLVLTLANRALYSDQRDTMDTFVAALETLNTDGKITNDITYLKALRLIEEGDISKAKELLEALSKDVKDRYNRARSEYVLTQLMLDESEITRAQAIERLNKLRMVWRGDAFELELLKRLGQLNIDEKNYLEGLRVWREIVTYFPNSQDALLIAKNMGRTFVYLFDQGGADTMSPLAALGLYYEFRELTPIGKLGDRMIQELANRLFEVDLLNRAAALLTHQVRYRLTGEDKARVGTRLALVHLLNKDPSRALEVLDGTEITPMPDVLTERRVHLRAQAYADSGNTKEALRLLAGDVSDDSVAIKLDIYWAKQAWDNVVELLTPRFDWRVNDNDMLNAYQSEQLVRLAIAHSFLGHRDDLNTLYTGFKGRVSDQYKDTFEFLTGSLENIDPRRLSETVAVGKFETFLDRYKKMNAE